MQTYKTQLNNDPPWALREGSMHFEGESAVHHTLRRLVDRLEELDVDYAIADGMALLSYGYRRFTEHIDVLVTAEGLERILEHLDGPGYVGPLENSKNVRDAVTGVRIDFIVAGGYPRDDKRLAVAFPNPTELAHEFDGEDFVSLPRLVELNLASSRASHRLGDLNDVQQLIHFLELPQDFSESLEPSLRESFLQKWQDAQKSTAEDGS